MVSVRTITDARGSLSVLEGLPFDIKRVYYLHGIAPDAARGGHAHKVTERLLLAVHGSFRVAFYSDDWVSVVMDDARQSLRIPPMEWIEVTEFSPDAVCVVLASTEHDEADCIRDFAEFKRLLARAA